MKPEVKRLWVKALRSGDYTQGRGYLKQEDRTGELSYCCLGVLCDLYEKQTGKKEFNDGDQKDITGVSVYKFGGSVILPNKHVVEWAGLESEYGFMDPLTITLKDGTKERINGLPYANDGLRLNFKQIADIIEEHL